MEKINKRLFAFGCSFTRYLWPTWADILGRQFDSFENWGCSGAGNQYIFNSLIECNLQNKINKNDIVCIMWTNVARVDRYINNKWIGNGNVYFRTEPELKWLMNFSDIRGYYIRDLAILYATEQLLKNIGCKYHFLSMVPLTNVDQYTVVDASDKIDDLIKYYKDTLDKISPSVFEVVFNNDWNSKPFLPNLSKVKIHYNEVAGPDWPTFEKFIQKDFTDVKPKIVEEILDKNQWDWDKHIQWSQRQDLHPIPSEHLEYLNKVLPEYSINQETQKWVQDIDEALWQKTSFDNIWKPVTIQRW